MGTANLSLDRTPPLSLPLRFFLTAPLFGTLAGLLLVWSGAEAAASRWTLELIGITHLVTLGVMAMVMFGAMQQLLPILTGAAVPFDRVSGAALHGLLTLGAALLGFGLFLGHGWLIRIALPLLAVAGVLFLATSLMVLGRSPARGPTLNAMRLALIALTITLLSGLWLAAGHSEAGISLARDHTHLHVTWALLGWVLLLTVGVALQVVPMFQVTPEYPRWLARSLAPLALAGLVFAAIPPLAQAGGGLLALLCLLFAGSTLHQQARRRRKVTDWTVHFWRLAMLSLIAAVAAWAAGYSYVAALLFIAGFALSAIHGMLYKIVPFLIWLHLSRTSAKAGVETKIPNMRQIIASGHVRLHFLAHCAALVLLGILPWEPRLAVPAGLLFAGSHALLAINLFKAARLYRHTMQARKA